MLPLTLNTNEVKDSAGTEIEYQSLGIVGRSHIFAKVGESPSLQDRLSINHSESGTGFKRRRRSNNRFDLTVISDIDNVTPVTITGYVVLDTPVGALNSQTAMINVLARIQSFLSTTGAGTTVLFNGTGNGAQCLLTGAL